MEVRIDLPQGILMLDDALRAAGNMERMGGGFASKLAKAYYVADSDNKQRILVAFDSLFRAYLPKPIPREQSVEDPNEYDT